MKKESCHDCPLEKLKPTTVRCTECNAGVFIPARGRFGLIYKCSNTKGCKYFITSRPTGQNCSHKRNGRPCGALMVEGTKTIPDRCNDRGCPNRNPHKL